MCNTRAPGCCPSCGEGLVVIELQCPRCGTGVKGKFETCPLCSLTGEDERLFHMFLESRGNLKHVQRMLGVSYPTVRSRIEELFRSLGARERHPLQILDDLHAGEITVEKALELLKGSDFEQGEWV